MMSSTFVLIAFRLRAVDERGGVLERVLDDRERAGGVGREAERFREPPMRVELHPVAIAPSVLAVELDRRAGSCAPRGRRPSRRAP